MKTLLRLEAYKILRCRSMLIMFAIVVALSMFIAVSIPEMSINYLKTIPLATLSKNYGVSFCSYNEFSGWFAQYVKTPERMFVEYTSESGPPMFLGMFFAVYFVSRNFAERTVNAAVYAGMTRRRGFWSRLSFYYIAAAFYTLAAFFAVQYLVGGGWPSKLPGLFIWTRIGMKLLLDLGTLSIPMLLAFLFKDYLRTVGATLLFIFGCIYLPGLFGENRIQDYILNTGNLIYTLPGKLGFLSEHLTLDRTALLLIVPTAHIVFTSAGAWFLFRRAELK